MEDYPEAYVSIATSPIADQVLKGFDAKNRDFFALKDLCRILQKFLQCTTLKQRLDNFVELSNWIRVEDSSIPLHSEDKLPSATATLPEWRRLHVLKTIFQHSPELQKLLGQTLGAIIAETHSVTFFAETGLPREKGFFSELSSRLGRGVFPSARNDADLEQQLRRFYKNNEQAQILALMPDDIFHELTEMLSMPDRPEIWQPALSALQQSFLLLSARVQGMGLSHELRVRGHGDKIIESPFFRFSRSSDQLISTLSSPENTDTAYHAWRASLFDCREECKRIIGTLEETGVSVSIVFSLEMIEKCLTRMETIASILTHTDSEEKSAAIHRLLKLCISGAFADQSIRKLVGDNIQLLARKIVERTGKTGEHYIAGNAKEYWGMWLAAAGGGLLTVGTASFKMKIVGLGAPPMVEGLLAGLNYAISFLIMLICHLALATKQPAMTGSTLAGILRDNTGTERLNKIISVFARICRTQIAAAMGNVIVVCIGCLIFDSLWKQQTGHAFLDAHEAEHVLTSLNPIGSGTILFAAITGCILWLSSLAGGWIENWAVINQLPQAVREHRLRNIFGTRIFRGLGNFIENNISSWGGSVVLGFMLGFTPILGKISGIPMDVRHVTLSTGTLALAAGSMGHEVFEQGLIYYAAAGIAVIFVLNLSVSFLLAFFTAVRAYGLSHKEYIQLASLLFKRLILKPWEFVLPIGANSEADAPTVHI